MEDYLVSEEGGKRALQILLVRMDEQLLDERLDHGRHAVELGLPRPDGLEEGLGVRLEQFEEGHLVEVRLELQALVAGGKEGRHGLQLLQPLKKKPVRSR